MIKPKILKVPVADKSLTVRENSIEYIERTGTTNAEVSAAKQMRL